MQLSVKKAAFLLLYEMLKQDIRICFRGEYQ